MTTPLSRSSAPDPLSDVFVVDFYNCLHYKPEQLVQFYSPAGCLIWCAQPLNTPVDFLNSSAFPWIKAKGHYEIQQALKTLQWAGCRTEIQLIQCLPSRDGILLLVKGHMWIVNEAPKPFVHTFCLVCVEMPDIQNTVDANLSYPKQKLRFFVDQDILCFLDSTLPHRVEVKPLNLLSTQTAPISFETKKSDPPILDHCIKDHFADRINNIFSNKNSINQALSGNDSTTNTSVLKSNPFDGKADSDKIMSCSRNPTKTLPATFDTSKTSAPTKLENSIPVQDPSLKCKFSSKINSPHDNSRGRGASSDVRVNDTRRSDENVVLQNKSFARKTLNALPRNAVQLQSLPKLPNLQIIKEVNKNLPRNQYIVDIKRLEDEEGATLFCNSVKTKLNIEKSGLIVRGICCSAQKLNEVDTNEGFELLTLPTGSESSFNVKKVPTEQQKAPNEPHTQTEIRGRGRVNRSRYFRKKKVDSFRNRSQLTFDDAIN